MTGFGRDHSISSLAAAEERDVLCNWQESNEQTEIVNRAVRTLGEGKLVAFPTETVYGIAASALHSEAVERLVHCKGRPEDKPLTLALRTAAEVVDWVPGLSSLGRRLSRRAWPGPVTLVFTQGVEQGLSGRLPEAVRRRVCANGALGLRVPAHRAVLEVMRRMPGPLTLTSANRSGEPDATSGHEVLTALGRSAETLEVQDDLALVIDDGPTRYGQVSTVVRIAGDRWEVLREGVVPARTLQQLANRVILFVCTGNTCRSPLAEGLCKKLLAKRLGCAVEELPGRGFVVLSAGASAMMGCGPSPEAVEAARAWDVHLEGHLSQPLTETLLRQADLVFAMTRSHLRSASTPWVPADAPLELLSPDGEDVPDPIGADLVTYSHCAERIVQCLEKRLEQIAGC